MSFICRLDKVIHFVRQPSLYKIYLNNENWQVNYDDIKIMRTIKK